MSINKNFKFVSLMLVPVFGFLLFFSLSAKTFAFTVNFQGHVTGSGGGCTINDTSECSSFSNTMTGQPGWGTTVYNCNEGSFCGVPIGETTPFTGGQPNFGSQNVSTYSNTNIGALMWTPPGATPDRAEYVCDVPGVGTGIPYTAPIGPNSYDDQPNRPSYTWSSNIPSDASCNLTIHYASEPSGGTNAVNCTTNCAVKQCGMGACQIANNGDRNSVNSCDTAADCQTNLSISVNPVSTTVNQGDVSAVYAVTFTFNAGVSYDNINIKAANATLGTSAFSWSGTGYDNPGAATYPDRGRVSFKNVFTGAIVTSRTLFLTVNTASLAVATYPITITAETGNVNGINADWTYNFSGCYGTCTPSAPATLIVQPGVIPPVVNCEDSITTAPANGTCSSITATGFTINWTSPAPMSAVQALKIRTSSSQSGANQGECALPGYSSYDPANCKDVTKTDVSSPVTNLQPSTLYYNRVAAACTNPDGTTRYKDVKWTCTTPAQPVCINSPNVTTINGVATPSVVYLAASTGNLTVNWNAVAGAVSYSVLAYNTDSGFVLVYSNASVAGTSVTFPVTPVAAGSRYQISISSNVVSPNVACPSGTFFPVIVRPPASSCPSVVPAPSVILDSTFLATGGTTTARVPSGYTCTGFNSSPGGVVTVDNAGNVVAVGAGNTSISATGCTYGGGLVCGISPTALRVDAAPPQPATYSFTLNPTTFNFSGKVGKVDQIACKDMVVANTGTGALDIAPIYYMDYRNFPVFTYDKKVENTGIYTLAGGASSPLFAGNICVRDNGGLLTSPGTYTETMAYGGYDPSNHSNKLALDKFITVNLTLTNPVYSYTVTGSLAFTAVRNGALPANQAITVTNTGTETLNIAVSEGISWAGISTNNIVNLTAGSSVQVFVNVNTTNLTPTVYNGSIQFSEPNAGIKNTGVQYTITNSPDFDITSSPASRSITSGSATTYTITLSSLNNFSGIVDLAAATNCPNLSTCTYSVPSPNVPAGGSVNSTLTVSTAVGTTAGDYVLAVTGTDRTASPKSHTTSPLLTVTSSLVPPTVDLRCNGSSGSASVAFNGSCALSWTVGGGAPTSCVASSSANDWTGNKNIAGGSETINGLTSSRSYAITCSNTAGSGFSTVSVTVAGAPDFNLSISPLSRTINQGGSTSYTVSVNSVNGFNQQVTLTTPIAGCPANTACSYSSNTVTPPANGSASVTMIVTAAANAATGNFTLTAEGKDPANNTRSANTALTINSPSPDFAIAINPPSNTVFPGGPSVDYTVDVISLNGFSQQVSLTSPGCPLNVTCNYSLLTVTPPPNGSVSVTMTVSASASAVVGTYSLVARGTDLASNTRSANAQLIISTTPGGTPYCDSVGFILNQTVGATGYRVYRTSGASPVLGTGSPDFLQEGGPGFTSYSEFPPSTTNNYYWNTYLAGPGFESAAAAISGSPYYKDVSTCPVIDPPTGFTGSGGASCGQINLSWNDVSGETGYHIWRNTVNSSSTAATIAIKGANFVSHTDNPPVGSYYYWLSAFDATSESTLVPLSNNPLGSSSCDASVGVNKDITKVNNVAPTGYTPSSTGGNDTPPNTIYRLGDLVSFAVNLNNTALTGGSSATNVVVTDRLTNLKKPAAGWSMKKNGSSITEDTSLDCSTSASAIASIDAGKFGVCGTAPNQILYIKVGTINQGALSAVTFNATISVPTGFTQSSSRFQNTVDVSYTKNIAGDTGQTAASTPLIIFSVSDVPTKREEAP